MDNTALNYTNKINKILLGMNTHPSLDVYVQYGEWLN